MSRIPDSAGESLAGIGLRGRGEGGRRWGRGREGGGDKFRLVVIRFSISIPE